MIKKIKTMINKHGFLSTASYLLFTVAFNKIGLEINSVYRDNSIQENNQRSSDFSFFRSFNDISKNDQSLIKEEYGIQYIDKLKQNINDKNIYIIGYVDNKVASTFWIKCIENEKKLPFKNYSMLCGDYTQQEYRGNGLQKKSINFRKHIIYAKLKFNNPIVIESSITNYASINSIEKSDFSKIGTYFSFRNKVLFSTIK